MATVSTTDAPGKSSTFMRRLMGFNLGLVALQPLSAGFFMSGYAPALTVHAIVALVLEAAVLVQAVTAVVLWRRRRGPAWMAGLSAALLVILFLQVGLGYRRSYWLHVPIGVAIFGWMQ